MKFLFKLGLKEQYTNDAQLNFWFKWLFKLALIPVADVAAEWVKIKAAKPALLALDRFVDYFSSTYVNANATLRVTIRNHFLTDGP